LEALILIISAFITSTISAILGMGGGIILLAIMALLLPEGYLAIALHGVIQLVSNTTRSFAYRESINWKLVREFLFGACFGLLLSSIIIFGLMQVMQITTASDIKVDFLKPAIGIFVLWFLYGKRLTPHHGKKFTKVGLMSGFATVFVGATGPLIAPYFLDYGLKKKEIIANKAVCQAISHTGKMPIFIFLFHLNYFEHSKVLLPLLVAVIIGTYFGKHILSFIPEHIFRLLFKSALTLMAIKLIIDYWV
jgi:uncharacterized membrane protein YfcA